ncbi:MAG: hypothetical protein IKN07_07190 [Lachnospiraceae bacterium]|nr:hypothetical protein [Lachnospiraceae bacterium]
MTAYDYLSQARDIAREIRQLKKMKQEYLAEATAVTASLTGMPGSVSKDPHKFDRYVLLVDCLNEKIRELDRLSASICRAVNSVPDSRQRYILRAKYIPDARGRCRTLKQIAKEMHYSESQVRRIHREGLASVEKKMNAHDRS